MRPLRTPRAPARSLFANVSASATNVRPASTSRPVKTNRSNFNDATVRAANLSSSEDDPGEFLVIQHSVSGNLLGGQWHSFGRRLIEDGAAHAPAQEGLNRFQGLIGGDRCPALLNGGDHLNDIALGNLMNAPASPGLADLPAKEPSDLAPGAVL